MIAENALFADLGKLFHPLFDAIGWALAAIYGIIPNYAVAIALLTIIIMLLLTPLTVKSQRSMTAMSAMQPEIKKLQAKYKGAENRQKLNEELMALYKERGINPAGSCLPMFLQMPFLILLYDTIKGLTNVVTIKTTRIVNGVSHTITKQVVEPRYIPQQPAHTSSVSLTHHLYVNLVAAHGHMLSFGMDLANKPFGHGLSAVQRIPFFAMVALAVGLQYFQMRQMNARNTQAVPNKQMQTMQKVTPILFAYIYFLVPAAVVIYMIVSTLIRIGTQDVMYRTGMIQAPGAERSIGGAKGALPEVAAAALVEETGPAAAQMPAAKTNGAPSPTRRPMAARNGKTSVNGSGNTNGAKSKPAHPRARGKRPRKAR